MAQYDGSIRINTNIDTSGLRRGITSTTGSLRSVSDAASGANNSLRGVSNSASGATSSLRSVGGAASSATSSFRDIEEAAEDTEESVNKLNSTIKKLGAVVATAFITGKISEFKKKLLEAGTEIEAIESQFVQVFGNLSPVARESLSSIADQAGIMEDRMKASYTKIAAFAKTTGMDTSSSLELANRAMVAVADSAAFYDRSLEETTESLQSFLKGNYENDAALGLSATEFTRNAAANRLYGKSFIELSESQKQFTLLQMVEDANKLSGALGQSAREADTYTNQVGNLNQAWKNLSATIGRIILPQAIEGIKRMISIINTINALIKKIAEAMGWLKPFTDLIGGGKKKGGGSSATVADGVASSMEDATKATKKAKKAAEGYLSPLDEINKFNKENKEDSDKGSSGSGVSGGTSASIPEIDYDTSGVDTVANKISEKFSTIFDTFKQAWESKGKPVVESFKSAFEGIKSVVESIINTWKKLWEDGTILSFLESILELFKTIFDIIASIATQFAVAWTSGAGYENVKSFLDMFTAINGLLVSIGSSIAKVFNNGTGAEIWSNILGIITGVYKIIGNIATKIKEAWEEAGLGDSIIQSIFDIFNNILETIHNITDSTAEWAEKLDFTPLLESIDTLLKELEPLTKNIGQGLEWFWTNVLLPIAGWTIEEAVPTFLNMLAAAIKVLNEVIEALKPLGQWLWEEFLKPLGEWAGDTIIAAMETVTNLLNDFASWISQHQETVQAFVTIVGTLGGGFIAVSKAIPLVTTVLGGLSSALGLIASPIGVAVAAAVALVAALSDLWATSDTFKKSVKQAFDKVKDSLTKAFNKIKKAVLPLIDSIKDLASSFIDFYENSPIKSIVALIASLAATLAGNVLSIAIDMISSAFSNFAKILGGAIDIITGVFDILTALFTLDFDKFKEGLGKIKDGLIKAFSGSIGNITMIGTDLIGGLLKGMLDALGTIGNWIKEHVFTPIIDWFKKLFGIHSPSTVMAEQGEFIIDGLLKGLKDTIDSVLDWFGKLPGWIKDKLGDAKDWLVNKGKNAIEGLKNGWEAVKESKIGKAAADIAEYLRTKAGTAKEWLVNKGKNAIQGLKDGWEAVKESEIGKSAADIAGYIREKAGTAKEWLVEKGKGAINGLKNGWEEVKESNFLSKVAKIKDEAFTSIGDIKDKVKAKGKDVIDGIHKGLTSNWNTLSSWFGDLGNKIQKALPTDLFTKFADVGKNIIGGIEKGITGAASTIKKGVQNVTSNITKNFKNDLKIHSPSKVMEELGGYVISGLINGLGDTKDITKWSNGIADELQSSMNNSESWVSSDGMEIVADSIKETIQEALDEIETSWNNTWKELGENTENISNAMKESVSKSLSETKNMGKSVLKELEETVKNTSYSIKENIESLLNEINGRINSVFSEINQTVLDTSDNMLDKANSTIDSVNSSLEEMANNTIENFNSVAETMKETIETSLNEINSVWDSVWTGMGEVISNVFDGTLNKISDIINSIISMIDDMSNTVVNRLNAISTAMASITTGSASNISMPKIANVSIPSIATGTYTPKNKEFSQAVNTNNQDQQKQSIFAMKQAFTDAIKDSGGLHGVSKGDITIKQYLDGKQVAESVLKQGKLQQMSSGKNIFMLGGT